MRVQAVSILRHQTPTTQALKRGVPHYALHQPFCDASAAMRLEYENVTDVGVRREVGNHPPKADLPILFVDSKTQGVLNRPRDNFPRDSLCPVAFR